MAKYQYHGAGPFPEEQDYMDANMRVIDSDLRKAVSEADYKELTIQRRGWYGVAIDIEYQEWTGHTYETCFTGEVIANSMLDAYNKAKNDQGGIRGILPNRAELTRVARIDKTDIDFLGMKNDYGFSTREWEEWQAEEAAKATENVRQRIGNRIRELRTAQHLSQDELAQMAGITRANLSNIEAGKYSAGLDILNKIATALGAEINITTK